MAEPSTHINYSFEAIQRYLQGKMSAAEMHAIEKAALQDQFLADAIEGFNEANPITAQQHLNEINAALLKEKKQSKVVVFNRKTQWMNVAALIIVLAGIGVVVSYLFKSSHQQTQIAQVKNAPVKKEALQDSTKSNINTSADRIDTVSFVAYNKSTKKEKKSLRRNITANKNASPNNDTEEAKDVVASVAFAPAERNESNATSNTDTISYKLNQATTNADVALQRKVSGGSVSPSTFSGKIIDKNANPVPFATLRLNKKQSTITDALGNFNLENKDTSLIVTASAIGFNSKTASLKPGENNAIVLQDERTNLNDVVIVGYGVSKKLKKQTPQPVGGWQQFNNYVLTQLNKDSTEQVVTNSDDAVELEFLVDNTGNPYNIAITKPLDETRNAKAIDILKSGPKWTNTSKNKKAKVTIQFNQP